MLTRDASKGVRDRSINFISVATPSPNFLDENRLFMALNIDSERRASETCEKFMAPHCASLDVLGAVL